MKLFKRFFLLKSLGAAAFSIALLAFNSCAEMTSAPPPTMVATASKTLYAPTFPEKTPNAGESLSYGERYYTVSQGSKRKISLSWNPVGIAKYYEIFAAQNINDTFLKVGETTKTEFDDSVGSGKTYYYKVRAVNTKNEYSEFSSIVKGTSLATPAISDIEINDSNATVFWYMGNVGVDTYAKNLVYEVHAKGDVEKIKTFKAWDEATGSLVEECTFENLSGNCEYKFQVFAYITSEQDNVEKSPEVTEKTLALYTPASPEFTASQGESINYVKLIITLPSKIQVSVEKEGTTAKSDEDYPLCFTIERKRENEQNWRTIVPCLYYNGSTTAPNAKAPAAYDDYKEGNMIEYQDAVGNTSLSVIRGAKYDYRIISCVDVNYSNKISSSFNDSIKSKADSANTAQGWAAARPTFKVKNYKRNLNDAGNKVDSVSLGLEAAWNDLGKASEYKYAVEYERDNGGAKETEWITDTNGNAIFDNLEKVSDITITYDIKNDEAGVKGTYRYTLYIFPAKYTDKSKIKIEPLDQVQAANVIGVDRDASEPTRDLKAEGGWTNYILLTWTPEDGVVYNIDWVKLDDAGTPSSESGTITSDWLPKDAQGKYTGRYEHSVPPGCKYRYTLIANTYSGNTDASVPEAATLGVPIVTFESNSYTDVTVSWKQVLAAEKYEVTLGSAGTFGGAASFTINKDGSKENVPNLGDGFAVNVDYDAGLSDIFTLTITNAPGYDDATLAGKAVPLVIEAQSEKDDQNNIKGKCPVSTDVWTIGPAALNLKGSFDLNADKTLDLKVNANNVYLKWNILERAAGYAVCRLRPKMTGGLDKNGNPEGDKDPYIDVCFVPQSGILSTDKAEAALTDGGKTITFTDKYKKAANSQNPELDQQYLALGIDFTYAVIPVKASGDIGNTIDGWDEIQFVGKAYKQISEIQKSGYTKGYGIALEASKAEYNDKVVLKWNRPKSAEDINTLTPTVWYRYQTKDKDDKGNFIYTDWTKIIKSIANADSAIEIKESNLASDAVTQALEYAITYSDSMDSNTNERDASYVDYLKDKFNKKITADEIKSVGYMFNLPKIDFEEITKDNENYYEEFMWHLYNYGNTRKVGNDDIAKYSLTVKNLNCSADEWPVCEYDKDGNVTSTTTKYDWYDITPDSTPNETTVTVKVTPGTINTSANTGIHDGLLKVMRDYKHYYTITATRGDLTATSTVERYRKISNDEFAKCVTLIVADSIYQLGAVKTGPKNKTLTGASGTYFARMVYNAATFYQYYYVYTDYRANFGALPGQASRFASDFILNCKEGPFGATVEDSIIGLGTNAITVTHKSGLKSYQGTVTLGCGNCDPKWVFGWPKDWNLTLSYENGFASDSHNVSKNETEFKQWFPLSLKQTLNASLNPGTDKSYPTMNGTWWEVRQK